MLSAINGVDKHPKHSIGMETRYEKNTLSRCRNTAIRQTANAPMKPARNRYVPKMSCTS